MQPISTNISVITNFGCRADCWYCIWKGHELENIQLKTDWDNLEKFLNDHMGLGKVSVSGGGDSLYEFKKHADWWDRFFKITESLNMLVDVHTREKFYNSDFWKRINRCVFSSDSLVDDVLYLDYLKDITNIRITHLVTKETTNDRIRAYLDYQKQIGCQLTVKQLVGFDDGGKYKKIRKKYPEIFHLDKGDYNIYYMPDNSIRDKFLEDD